jgi:hypothetical protein
MVLLNIFTQDVEDGKRYNKVQHLFFDWLDGLIGLGGLLFLINKLL